MFNGLKNNIRKTQAAAIVEKLLEMQARDYKFHLNPAKTANYLVAHLWQAEPDIYKSEEGKSFSKIVIAAIALMRGFNEVFYNDQPNRVGIVLALGVLDSDIRYHSLAYKFNSYEKEVLNGIFSYLNDIQTKMYEENPLLLHSVLYGKMT